MIHVLLANEWGWPGTEIQKVLESAGNVELLEMKRSELEGSCPELQTFDVVLTFGPHRGRLIPLLQRVADARRKSGKPNPKVIWWLNENLPDWKHPALAKVGGSVRMAADYFTQWLTTKQRRRLGTIEMSGHRYRLFGTALWGHHRGLLDVLAVTSEYRRRCLEKLGIRAVHAPMGWGPSEELGVDLGLDRDIPVLWLGTSSWIRKRRGHLLERIKEDLAAMGIQIRCVTGGLSGDDRTELINRSRILLNLLRERHDFTGHRLLLGGANKALVISEPMVDAVPFVPGQHIVFCAVDQMAETIAHYLNHEEECRAITTAAYNLVHETLTMERAVGCVFEAAGLPLHFNKETRPLNAVSGSEDHGP